MTGRLAQERKIGRGDWAGFRPRVLKEWRMTRDGSLGYGILE